MLLLHEVRTDHTDVFVACSRFSPALRRSRPSRTNVKGDPSSTHSGGSNG